MKRLTMLVLATTLIVGIVQAETITVNPSNVVVSETQGSVQDTQNVPMAGNSWYLSGSKEFALKNNTALPIDLSNVHIFFNLGSSSATTSIWSATLNNSWTAIRQVSNSEYVVDQVLEPGATLRFTLNLAQNGPNLVPGNISVTAKLGEILVGNVDLTAKAQNGAPAPSEIMVRLTGPTLSEPIEKKISSYGAATQLVGVPVGTYTITATISEALYSATVSPSSVTISKGLTSPVTIFYKKSADPTLKSLTLTAPTKPTTSQSRTPLPASVNVVIKDSSGNIVVSKAIGWGKSLKIANLKQGQTYSLQAAPYFDGQAVYIANQSIKLDGNSTLAITYQADASVQVKPLTLTAANLGTGSATVSLYTPSFGGLPIQINSVKNGTSTVKLPVASYTGSALSLTAGSASVNAFNLEQSQALTLSFTTANSGSIVYHVTFPYTTGQHTAEVFPLTSNYTDLVMSNYIAGVLLGQLIKETPLYANIRFNKDYIYGTILSQLLQENIDTTGYSSASDDINPPSTKGMILASGQGGPYQLNDYSKRLENVSGAGLINYVVLQKSLGYSVADQDSGAQTARTGPDSLDNKYFGPIAATYFHHNDIQRFVSNNKQPWGPQSKDYAPMMANFSNGVISDEASFFDMILNTCYNAGSYSDIFSRFVNIAANYTDPKYQTAISNMGNYTLNDAQYNAALGMNTGGTYIIYPRQVRFYLDQLYNTNPVLQTNSAMFFPMTQLKFVFAKSMGTLGYINANGQYEFIPESISNAAFDAALATNKVPLNATLNISSEASRLKIYAILENALQNVESSANMKFNALTEKTLNGAK